jgi:histone H1/5
LSKKSTSKSAVEHPSWKDIIKEAIVNHPEDARAGVSRTTIKKYAEETYKLDMTSASNLHQLNLALTRGAEKETFVFPKGPSGKVKLAPKRPRVPAEAKENTQPPKKSTATKKVAEKTKAAPAKKASASRSRSTEKAPTTKKPSAITKKVATTTKKAATVKKPTKKTTSTKNDTKKVAAKAAAAKAKTKPASKTTKPVSKTTKTASAKAKPRSRGAAKPASRRSAAA